MVHSYVLPFKVPFLLSLEEVANITEADIVLIGHFHGFGEELMVKYLSLLEALQGIQ